MDPLEDYQPICFSPFCQQGPKRLEELGGAEFSSSAGVFRITALLGGVVSNLNRSVKPSSSSSASVHIIDSPFHVRRHVS